MMKPNHSSVSANLPFFHVTDYGQKVLEAQSFVPHDPTGFLKRFRLVVPNPDATVEAYLAESLDCFTKGNLIASVVMLGVASERAFLVLCETLHKALGNPKEKTDFGKILDRFPIKPKMDWVSDKIQSIQQTIKPKPLPDDVDVMLTSIFNFIRRQRNDLGHPKPTPPKTTREEAFANLIIFPEYYRVLTAVVDYLTNHSV